MVRREERSTSAVSELSSGGAGNAGNGLLRRLGVAGSRRSALSRPRGMVAGEVAVVLGTRAVEGEALRLGFTRAKMRRMGAVMAEMGAR